MEYLLGVVVSLIVEAVKNLMGTDTFATHVVLFAVSVVGAALYVTLSATTFWPAVLSVLVVAAAFHNLIIRKFEE